MASPTTRTLKLTASTGLVVLIDEDCAGLIADRLLHTNRVGDRDYAFFYIAKSRIALHRLFMDAPKDKVVDHINGRTLDNRRANLRVCTARENSLNSRARGGRCGYKGVTKHNGKFVAAITLHGERLYLGLYDYPEEAACVYNAAAARHFGEFARLNDIPDTVDP